MLCFLKNICDVRKSEGGKLSTTGIALRIMNQPGVSEQAFRKELAERCINLTIISGGSLASKFFIPFGKEYTLWDSGLTHIIEQQNLYLHNTKERIVRNINSFDEEIDLEVNDDVDMDEQALQLGKCL
jgi:hypothetical protein